MSICSTHAVHSTQVQGAGHGAWQHAILRELQQLCANHTRHEPNQCTAPLHTLSTLHLLPFTAFSCSSSAIGSAGWVLLQHCVHCCCCTAAAAGRPADHRHLSEGPCSSNDKRCWGQYLPVAAGGQRLHGGCMQPGWQTPQVAHSALPGLSSVCRGNRQRLPCLCWFGIHNGADVISDTQHI
jgi:hypothetical protein